MQHGAGRGRRHLVLEFYTQNSFEYFRIFFLSSVVFAL
jgi:hypothetical protein